MPRSGSTLLCDLLTQTGVAGAPDSFFRWQSMPDFAANWGIPAQTLESFDQTYLQAALKHGSANTGCFGMRIMWNNMAPLCKRLGAMFPGAADDVRCLEAAFGPLRFLHLSRADKVAEAVSLTIAHQTGLWHRNADGTELERLKPHAEPVYDADQIMQEYETVTQGDISWRKWFEAVGIAPLCISYEALSADPPRQLARILDFLGLDHRIAERVRPGTAKLATGLSAKWAARFRAEMGIEMPATSA